MALATAAVVPLSAPVAKDLFDMDIEYTMSLSWVKLFLHEIGLSWKASSGPLNKVSDEATIADSRVNLQEKVAFECSKHVIPTSILTKLPCECYRRACTAGPRPDVDMKMSTLKRMLLIWIKEAFDDLRVRGESQLRSIAWKHIRVPKETMADVVARAQMTAVYRFSRAKN